MWLPIYAFGWFATHVSDVSQITEKCRDFKNPVAEPRNYGCGSNPF